MDAVAWRIKFLEHIQVLQHFGCDAVAGLTDAQVAEGHRRHGYNELPPQQATPFWTLVLKQFDDLLVKILLVAAVTDFLISVSNGERGVAAFVDPVVILVILAANATVGVLTETNAEAAITALKALEADSASAVRGGRVAAVPVRDVVPGDLLELAVGEKVPADCYVLEVRGAALSVDQSILTGESGSVGKVAGPVDAPAAAVAQDKHDVLFSGSLVTMGRARAVAFATGPATAMGRINDALAESADAPTPLKQKLDEFGALLSKVIAVVCVAVWVVNIGAFGDPAHGGWFKGALYYFKVAVALAVAAILEGLPAVVTTCLALGTRKMAAKRAIVRSLPSVETLGCTTVVCVDKTGTLTSNAMAAVRAAVPTAAGIASYTLPAPHVAATGRVCDAESGQALRDATEVQGLLYLALCASVCNDSTLVRRGADGSAAGQHIGDSTDVALRLFAERIGLPSSVQAGAGVHASEHWQQAYARQHVLEFDRQRKLMSVCCSSGGQHLIFTKGAPEVLLQRCTFAIDEEGSASTELTPALRQHWEQALEQWGSESALRCIACAYAAVPGNRAQLQPEDEGNLVFLGALGLQDPPRPEAADAVQACFAAGIRLIMLTEGKSAAALDVKVMARVEPHHKQTLVEALQAQNEVVAMTGDGVNDAPALRRADIGIAMGSGTAVARHASDMVLADDNFSTIVAAVAEGRCIFANTKQFIRYMVSSNIGEVVAIFAAALLGLPSTLSPVQLLWVNLVTDGLPATALSFNKADADVMRARPRRPQEGIVDRWLFIRYLIVGLYVGVATVAAYIWWFTAYTGGPRMTWADLRAAHHCTDADVAAAAARTYSCAIFRDARPSTVAMSVLVAVEMFNALNALSENRSLLSVPPSRNWWLVGAIGATMALHLSILYVAPMASIFGVTGLSVLEWRAIIVISFPVILLDEALKAVSRQPAGSGGIFAFVSGLVQRAVGRTTGYAGLSTAKQRH